MRRNPTLGGQLLKKYRRPFLCWLRESGQGEIALQRIAAHLADFLISRINNAAAEWAEAPVEFWNRIPDVRSCCSDVETFTRPWAVEAYAYVHLLQRYRRTWATLEYLTELAVLPLGTRGVRVLDVGTGPAPALYAIDDFYEALSTFAKRFDVPELNLPPPQLACVEHSQNMVWFFHCFSEFSGRRGPFGPIVDDFSGLDLASRRALFRSQNETERYWHEETEQYEEIYDPVSASAEAERLFRYRLVVLSNFLTVESDLERFEAELRKLFEDLKAGGIVLVLGATGDSYQKVYERLSSLALESGLRDAGWHADNLARIEPTDPSARVIKEAQHRVFRHIAGLVGSSAFQRGKAWPDYWSPEPSPKARPQFALRVFRSGRWPTGKNAA